MAAFPQLADTRDVPHLGVLLKRIREARGLSQSDIARMLEVSSSTISKLEGTGRSRRNHIVERYIVALRSLCPEDGLIPYPISDDSARLLAQLCIGARPNFRDALAADIGAYDFALIASPNCPRELQSLLLRLRRVRYPAFICDGLWFLHVVNSAMLNLLDTDPLSPAMHQWENWHIIASELAEGSPVRANLAYQDIHLPLTLWAYFRAAAPYLFTPQMRALLWQLHLLAAKSAVHFAEWWHSATALTMYFQLGEIVRVYRRGEQHHLTAVMQLEPHSVLLNANTRLPYYVGIMEPIGGETVAAFRQLTWPAPPGELFLAADFDLGHNFHVNCWPEVAAQILG